MEGAGGMGTAFWTGTEAKYKADMDEGCIIHRI